MHFIVNLVNWCNFSKQYIRTYSISSSGYNWAKLTLPGHTVDDPLYTFLEGMFFNGLIKRSSNAMAAFQHVAAKFNGNLYNEKRGL